MALSTATVWEVRSATGSDNNGGGFVTGSSGTDYSQQAAPQYALTGLASAGAGSTLLYAGAAVVMVGNLANAVSGTNVTTGIYQISSVSVGVSITFDRAITTGVGASIVLNIGGALAKLSTAVTNATQNNQINCTGSETITTTITFNKTYASGAYPPFSVIGYNVTRGDGGQFTVQSSTNSVNILTYSSSAGQVRLLNLIIKSTAGTPGDGIESGTAGGGWDLYLDNCRITGCKQGIRGPFSTQYFITPLVLNNCQIDNCTSDGILNICNTIILNSYIHDNAGYGVNCPGTGGQGGADCIIIGSVIYKNANGVLCGSNVSAATPTPLVIINSAIVSNTTNGINCTAAAQSVVIINSIVYANGVGFNCSGVGAVLVGTQLNNAVGANTTLRTNFPTGIGEITLTADPFTNKSAGDFTLNSTAGGGAACKAAGYQSTIL